MMDEVIWTEKHRPETLNEVIGQEQVVDNMKTWVDDDSISHLLLQGPAGTGKTSVVTAFAKEKYGNRWEDNLIEINASDDCGIDYVRGPIKKAASQAPAEDYEYKIIFLDEADNLTDSAQSALRRIMERYSDQTRFFLSCNYVNKIIDPIQSRCTPLPFDRLEKDQVKDLLVRILEKEAVEYEIEAVDKIVEFVGGDARRAVQSLQMSVEDRELTQDYIDIVEDTISEEKILEVIKLASNGEVDKATEMNVSEIQPNIINHSSFAKKMMNCISDSDAIPRDIRFYALSQIGDVERNVLEGCNPHVQWNSFLAKLPVIQHASTPEYDG